MNGGNPRTEDNPSANVEYYLNTEMGRHHYYLPFGCKSPNLVRSLLLNLNPYLKRKLMLKIGLKHPLHGLHFNNREKIHKSHQHFLRKLIVECLENYWQFPSAVTVFGKFCY